jgi:NAD(P)-dependent dehydrogenase (short-subunit alcohol dehydrogenase family)
MPSRSYLVTGASRGIGLELARQLASQPNAIVYAGMRNPPKVSPFGDAKNVHIIQLDQTSTKSVAAAAAQISELDSLILNAAIGEDDHLTSITSQRLTTYLDSNVVGPHRVVQAFLPALLTRPTRKIIYISSTAGSLRGQVGTSWGLQGPYAVTKAAGNMMVVQWDNELRRQNFTVVSVHPSWVKTEMGNLGGDGGIPVEESVEGLLALESKVTTEDGAKFFDYDGSILDY